MKKPIIVLSGGFDPYHDGHVKMFEEAATLGDICVILNSDDWLIKKKGRFFMNIQERARVLFSVKGVVCIWDSKSLNDVSQDLVNIKNKFPESFIVFGKGGDRNASNTPEQEVCKNLGIPVIFGLGGNNEQSSSKILARWGSPNA